MKFNEVEIKVVDFSTDPVAMIEGGSGGYGEDL